jgi:hypothetical protein
VAPPIKLTTLLDIVVSVLGIWKTYTPGPLRVTVPVISAEDPK